MVVRVAAALLLLATAATARADDELDTLSPRAIGHAGASLVSDDGPAALFACPAALARRSERRAQLAGLFIDDDVWLGGTTSHPRISDRGPAELAPLAGAIQEFGPLIVGLAFTTTASIDRRLPAPEPGLPAATVSADFPHRYAALELRRTQRTLALGAAVRATDWLALGLTATVARADAREARRIWAGFGGRDPLGDPQRDITVTVDGRDGFVPGAAAGLLIAPADVPLELALGAAWSDDLRAGGTAVLTTARNPPTLDTGTTSARGDFAAPLTLHAGVRWVGARYTVEGGATAWSYRDGVDDGWQLAGVRIVDDSGAEATLTRFATRAGRRTHGALRASADVEVLPGFLWLAGGYAWRGAGQSRLATTLGGIDGGGHTLAFGAELTAGAAVITLGWSRQLARTIEVTAPALPYDNPFAGGAEAANLGKHGQARDLVGLGLELTIP